jgi:predicted nucleic acid-binding protein
MDLLTDFMDLPIERWPATGALLRRAFQLPHNLSSYDAAYVVLAEALACPLVTRDARLAKAAPSTVEVEVW